MCGLLVVGFLANLLVRPVAEKYWRREDASAEAAAKSETGRNAWQNPQPAPQR